MGLVRTIARPVPNGMAVVYAPVAVPESCGENLSLTNFGKLGKQKANPRPNMPVETMRRSKLAVKERRREDRIAIVAP
jgi:hypothetical protein